MFWLRETFGKGAILVHKAGQGKALQNLRMVEYAKGQTMQIALDQHIEVDPGIRGGKPASRARESPSATSC